MIVGLDDDEDALDLEVLSAKILVEVHKQKLLAARSRILHKEKILTEKAKGLLYEKVGTRGSSTSTGNSFPSGWKSVQGRALEDATRRPCEPTVKDCGL